MIAVLTGDIVSSRNIPDKRKWLKRLEDIIEHKTGLPKPPKFGVFRGDGFQVELPPPEALRIAILIRAGLKSVPELFEQEIDARIGIGIGEKGFTGKSINESDGEAYQWSGNVLDSLKNHETRLEIKTPWPQINASLNISLQLASVIIDDWTEGESEIAWIKLSEDKTQTEMAKKLKITQPAVHKRSAGAHLNEISNLISYFENTITTAVKENHK